MSCFFCLLLHANQRGVFSYTVCSNLKLLYVSEDLEYSTQVAFFGHFGAVKAMIFFENIPFVFHWSHTGSE